MITKIEDSVDTYKNLHYELIEGCKHGDRKAQFQIYRLYYKTMYNISLRIVNNTQEAEDIMQESFLSAFENIGLYSGRVSFGAWLKKIVQNRSLDVLRKEQRFVIESIESVPEIEEKFEDIPVENEETAVRLNKVKEAIRRLPGKCRNILSLHLFEGYDHDEISELLSISTSTSRSQFSRARKKLIWECEAE